MTTLFITPLHKECMALTDALKAHGYTPSNQTIGRLSVQHFAGLDITLAVGGHGKTQFGIQTQHLLDQGTAFELVVCLGAAGALSSKLAVGDLVIATEIVEHDYTERFDQLPSPRFTTAETTQARLHQLPLNTLPFQTHFDVIASGDEDIVEVARAKALHRETGACAVGWEGAGGARACHFNEVPFIELRGITDTANHDAPADFQTNLRQVMANAALFIIMWRT